MMEKICVITTAHQKDDVRIYLKQILSLKKNYSDITLIAQNEKDETINGIKIKSLRKPNGRVDRMIKLVMEAAIKAWKLDADIYHFHDPECIPLGLLMKLKGKKVVFDAHENVREQILNKYWINKNLRKLISFLYYLLEAFSVRWFDGVITVAEHVGSYYEKMNKNVILIKNYPIMTEFLKLKKEKCDTKYVIYSGSITKIRSAKEMVQSFENIKDVKLLLCGTFSPQKLQKEVEELDGWRNVEYLGQLQREKALKQYEKSLIGLVLFKDEGNLQGAVPNKLYEYMAASIPVIATDISQWRKLLEENECGLVVNPENPKEVANKIKKLLENPKRMEKMGENGRNLVKNNFNWDIEEKKLLKFYKKILIKE